MRAVRIVTILNTNGLHLLPSRRFADVAQAFKASVSVRNRTTNGEAVDGASPLELPLLGAARDHELEIVAEGEDAEAAVAALASLVSRQFDQKPD